MPRFPWYVSKQTRGYQQKPHGGGKSNSQAAHKKNSPIQLNENAVFLSKKEQRELCNKEETAKK